MDVEQLKEDVREGRVDVDRLVDMMGSLQRQLTKANQRIRELEEKLGGAATTKLDQPFSLQAEEKRQEARGRKAKKKKKQQQRQGRLATAHKLTLAEREESVFPEGVDPQQCKFSHSRPVWRLEEGRAVLVAYHVYRAGNRYGKIPGTLGRSEFGLEITVAIAYQVFIVGLSLDKACQVMNFFQNLRLTKSQADALMNQLARHWESEFDSLCTLLAHSAVVHADETSWSRPPLRGGARSVWAFLSEKVRVLLFGVHKDADTLKQILDPATFAGIVISDDAAVYANFTQAQKCWAHLLRKAIKLTLLEPDNAEYRRVADRLLEIYYAACRALARPAPGRGRPCAEGRPARGRNPGIVRTCVVCRAAAAGRPGQRLSAAVQRTDAAAAGPAVIHVRHGRAGRDPTRRNAACRRHE